MYHNCWCGRRKQYYDDCGKRANKRNWYTKSIGAQPWEIIGMILHEAIFVTAISGFTGLILSMALLEVVGPNIEIDYVVNPSVNFQVAFATVIVLIIAGTIAGFFPAWRAVKVHTIEALRDE